MKQPSWRPSPPLLISVLALLLALGGTVYAANRINGRTIRARSIPGNRLRLRSVPANRLRPGVLGRQITGPLTGADIDENSLGTVPSAIHAQSADTARSAIDAETALNAVNAVDAQTVNGFGAGCAAGSRPFAGACLSAKPLHITAGFLLNNLWSFAGDDDRADVNAMTLQPFVNYNLDKGWYLVSAPLITANWEADGDNRWTVPIGGGFGRIFEIGHQPINAQLTAYYNAVKPDDTGADWQLRAEWTFLFPKH